MKRSLRTVVLLALSVGLLALFFRGADLSVVWFEMSQADSRWVMSSAVITVVTMVLRAIRWQYLLAPVGHARFVSAFRASPIGAGSSR
jgi:uncharacterized membrane protein YbhN (UPF0104 family)